MRFVQLLIVAAAAAASSKFADGSLPFLSSPKYTFPANEYEYSFQRDRLFDMEGSLEGSDISQLNADELIVNNYLDYLRQREFKGTRDTGFPPSRPIEENLAYIGGTEIYKALKKLPKGGNIHSFEDHELSKRKLLEIVWASPDFKYLHILPPNHPTTPWTIDFFVNPPVATPAWVKVQGSDYTLEKVLQYQTLIGILSDYAKRYPTDSDQRWREVNQLWGRGSTQIICNYDIKLKYLEALYNHNLEEGVQYYESHKVIIAPELLYVMDPSGNSMATNGKRFLDPTTEYNVTKALLSDFTQRHPEYIGHRRVGYTFRMGDIQGSFKTEMEDIAELNELIPNHVIGFDIVGNEDAGNSLLFYLERFLAAGPNLPLLLHAAETSWPDNLQNSVFDFDPVSASQNSIESLLLMTERIGHGLGFIKHPLRVELLKKRNVVVECCPVSNQILGYVPDARQHPALFYHRSGIPVVLGSDDPGTFGYDSFTVDWYYVYMAWGINLVDLGTLAVNSLEYSTLSGADKKTAIEDKWGPAWDRYIASMKAEACARDFPAEAGPLSFAGILPREGAINSTTKVHVYGRGFERAICKQPKCRFGTAVVSATYIDSTHLSCIAPAPLAGAASTVAVAVSIDGSTDYRDTAAVFTYKYAPLVA